MKTVIDLEIYLYFSGANSTPGMWLWSEFWPLASASPTGRLTSWESLTSTPTSSDTSAWNRTRSSDTSRSSFAPPHSKTTWRETTKVASHFWEGKNCNPLQFLYPESSAQFWTDNSKPDLLWFFEIQNKSGCSFLKVQMEPQIIMMIATNDFNLAMCSWKGLDIFCSENLKSLKYDENKNDLKRKNA